MQQEEPLFSKQKMNEYKEREFREYLVQQGMTLSIVKFLLSLRNQTKKPDSPSQALIEYFNSQKNEQSWDEYEQLETLVMGLKNENNSLQSEVDQLYQAIEQSKLDKLKREEEARLREEEAKKNTKKPAKK